MVTLDAHFDGKVIVPDEPLDLPPNQKLRIRIEPIEPPPARPRTDFSEWLGLASGANDRPYDPAEEDALWEKGPLGSQPESDVR